MKCISLFSGAGGLDVGAMQAGVDVVACVENDADCVKTLQSNQRSMNTRIIHADIRSVDCSALYISRPCIVIGGPPCQPFSKNGYWIKNVNRLIESDPRNLLGQFVRAIAELRPTGFLFENVESILHPTNRSTFAIFLSALESQGYRCTTYRANAADFGVPQKRKRIFVFGTPAKRDDIPVPVPTHCDHHKSNLFSDLKPYCGVREHIEKFASSKYLEPEEDASSGTYFFELTNVPPGKNYMALSRLPNYTGRVFQDGSRFWNFLNKLHPDHPSITIAAQPGPWVGPFHWDNRRLRVPESAALQTFPDGYRFHGSRRSIQRQIGNAVPCLLARHMISHLTRCL